MSSQVKVLPPNSKSAISSMIFAPAARERLSMERHARELMELYQMVVS